MGEVNSTGPVVVVPLVVVGVAVPPVVAQAEISVAGTEVKDDGRLFSHGDWQSLSAKQASEVVQVVGNDPPEEQSQVPKAGFAAISPSTSKKIKSRGMQIVDLKLREGIFNLFTLQTEGSERPN